MNIGQTVGPLSVRDLLRAMNHGVNPTDNWQCKMLGPITTPAGNTEFTVQHNLGRIPTNYIWNVDGNVIVYDSRRVNWTVEVMFLKCSGAAATLYLIVL